MSYSLPSRDLIADAVELIVVAQAYDGNISIPGCDKNMPGVLMAAVRHNRPTIIVYGGTIQVSLVILSPQFYVADSTVLAWSPSRRLSLAWTQEGRSAQYWRCVRVVWSVHRR